MKPPRQRSHFAIKFTAFVMRLVAILFFVTGVIGGLATTQLQTPDLPGLAPVASGIAYVVVIAVALIYAIILWGFADALVLIADTNDAQRIAQAQIAQLMAERGLDEPRAALVVPVTASDATERLPPADR
jgi:hypothetical protein